MFQEFQNMIEKVFYELITQCVKLLDLPNFLRIAMGDTNIIRILEEIKTKKSEHNDKHLGITPLY